MTSLLQWFLATEKGRNQHINEDCSLVHPEVELRSKSVRRTTRGAQLCVVADNLGSTQEREQSRKNVLERIRELYYYNLQEAAPDQAILTALRQASREHAGSTSQKADAQNQPLPVALVVADGTHAYVVSLGNTRAYLWREGHIQPVATHPESADDPFSVLQHVTLQPRDRLLLCTDGLYTTLDAEQIGPLLGGTPERAAQKLVSLARERGAKDHITAAVGYYGPPRPQQTGRLTPISLPSVANVQGNQLLQRIRQQMQTNQGIQQMWQRVQRNPLLWGVVAGVVLLLVLGGMSTLLAGLGGGDSAASEQETAHTTSSATAAARLVPSVIVQPLTVTNDLVPTTTSSMTPTPTTTTTPTPSPTPRPIRVLHEMLRLPRLEVRQVSDSDKLSEQEQQVYLMCQQFVMENPARAAFVLTRDTQSLEDALNFAFIRESGAAEIAGIPPGEQLRDTCFQTALMPVAVSVEEHDDMREEYPFEASRIYQVQYTDSAVPVFASSEDIAAEPLKEAEQQAMDTCPLRSDVQAGDARVIFSAQEGIVFTTVNERTAEGEPYVFALQEDSAACYTVSSQVERVRVEGTDELDILLDLRPGMLAIVRQ